MRARVTTSWGLVLLLSASAAAQGPSPAERTRFLEMFSRAYYPGRSGQVMIVPRAGEILTRKGPEVRFMHGSPWEYDTRIPIFFWGPGRIRRGVYPEMVAQHDVAPTLARILGVRLPTATGRVLASALVRGAAAPKVVLLIVLDGMRADYLERHAQALPTLLRLRREGADFPRARVTHVPTVTSAGHATLATGAEPRVHGIVANSLFDRTTGKVAEPFPALSPRNLMAMSLGDAWAIETDGRAMVAALTSTAGAGGLAGHGSCLFNGRPTLFASYRSSGAWETDTTCFRLPAALAPLNSRAAWEKAGGTWMGHAIDDTSKIRNSAPFSVFEGDALVALLESEGLGTDAVPDLVLANLKSIDYVGHAYGPESAEMAATLAEQDRQITRILATLDARVGRDGYVLAIAADHGMPSEPRGARGRHYDDEIVAALHERLDPAKKLVTHYGPENSQLHLDKGRLATLGLTLGKVRDAVAALPFVYGAFTEDEVRAVVSARPSPATAPPPSATPGTTRPAAPSPRPE